LKHQNESDSLLKTPRIGASKSDIPWT